MSATILNGKECADSVINDLKLFIEKCGMGKTPTLVIYRIGNDPASEVYVRNKVKAGARAGIIVNVREFPADVNPDTVIDHLDIDALDENVDGMMIQLPLPEGWDARDFIEYIPPSKDVDGLTYYNMGALHEDLAFHKPCTAKGIMYLLHENGIHLTGKHVVVVGRSEIVGKPAALLALGNNATVTICHSKTKNLAEMTKQADVLIAAVGKEKLITANMVKPGAVVIDVGINRNAEGKLCGDVDFENVKEVASAITPVPGGIGPMTVAMLMMNVVNAAYVVTV